MFTITDVKAHVGAFPFYVDTKTMFKLPLSTLSCRGISLHLSKIAQNSENTQRWSRHSLISKIMWTKSVGVLDLEGDCWLLFVLILRTARHVRCNEAVKFQMTYNSLKTFPVWLSKGTLLIFSTSVKSFVWRYTLCFYRVWPTGFNSAFRLKSFLITHMSV